MTFDTSDTNLDRLAQRNWPLASPLGPLYPYNAHKPISNLMLESRQPSSGLKRLSNINEVFEAFEIKNGSVISFHHHYRNGDRLLNHVLDVAARRGLRHLTLAASSIFPVHAPIIQHMRSGVIANIITDYVKGPVADEVAARTLKGLVILQTHGGRARSITSGELKIDAAFIGASIATGDGSATGRGGKVPCGPLGYAIVDAAHAKHTAVFSHEIIDSPLELVDIPGRHVDALVQFDFPGNTDGIASDTTIPSATEAAKVIGGLVADVVTAAGLLKGGLALQSGAGGYSLASVPMLGQRLASQNIKGSFLSGGITGAHVDILEAGLFSEIRDVQCFDNCAVKSSIINPNHLMMSASEYANPLHPSPIVDRLTVMLLGAVEIDRNFNVNVTMGGNGRLIGGPGGHPDTASGSQLSIVTSGLLGGGFSKLTESVRSISTPGGDIDVLVTDAGIAVNPRNSDLLNDLKRASLPVLAFEDLETIATERSERPPQRIASSHPCAFIEHRCGHILDWI